MLRHIVLVKFQPEVSVETIQEVFMSLSELSGKLSGIRDFQFSDNVSVEPHVTHGFQHAFSFDFADEAARDAYLVDPEHQALGVRLLELAGGLEGIVVMDMSI